MLVVAHGKYMHYKTYLTTPVSLSHALEIVSLMSELRTFDSENSEPSPSSLSLKYRPNHVLNLYQDATICRKRISTVLDSGLSSWRDLGAHDHQYPHFFITLYEKLAVLIVPGVQQRWEV